MSPISSSVDSSYTSLLDRMDEWISRQHTLLVVAQESQLRSDQHKVVESGADVTDYPINSYVLYTPPMGRGNKLLPRHRGPYKVKGRKQSVYFMEDLVLGKQIRTHVHNLRPFLFNPHRINPQEVAQQKKQEFLVRDIIAHRGNHHRRSSMEFLVRCEFQQLGTIQGPDACHTSSKMRSLIPREHK